MSLETFFRGRLDAMARMGEVQTLVDERFPQLYVPNLQAGEAWALRPAQLRDAANTRSLALAANQVSFIAFQYPGHEAFISEAVEVLSKALATMGIAQLSRVSYRYDNAIDMPRDDRGCLPLDQLLNLGLPAWMGRSDFQKLSLDWTHVRPWGNITGRLFHEDQASHSTLRIVIAATVEPAGPPAELERQAGAAHSAAVDVFEGMISDQFRAFLNLSPTEDVDG